MQIIMSTDAQTLLNRDLKVPRVLNPLNIDVHVFIDSDLGLLLSMRG